jgi:hypothetical protein
MLKLVISFIVVMSLIVTCYVLFRLVKEALRPTLPPPPGIDVDGVIEELEIMIQIAETQAKKGIKSAEETLTFLQLELTKAQELKNK